jgi:hypothetical protein
MPCTLAGGEIIDHPGGGIAHGEVFRTTAGGRRIAHRIRIVEHQRDLGILLPGDADLHARPDIHFGKARQLH